LLLIRHAKAEQDGATDAARELSGRGNRDALAAGEWLTKQGFVPDHVVISDALRAAQTWEAIATAMNRAPTVVTERRIYDNTVESLLAVAAEAPDDAATVALVGHNPSMHGLAMTLDDGEGDPAGRTRLAASFPTMAIAVFEVDGSWCDLAARTARLIAFDAPRSR
jgi:phosphohistidine phosphatase